MAIARSRCSVRHALLAVMFVTALSAPLFAQSAATIAGTVVDSSGAPIPDAAVRLEVSGARVDEARTSNDGHFEFRTAPADNMRVAVSAAGFAQFMQPIDGPS